jgi:hypothetical protein
MTNEKTTDSAASALSAGLCLADNGRDAHVAWEAVRGDENECEAESRIRHSGGVRSREWWDSWFARSDEWRDEIGHEA